MLTVKDIVETTYEKWGSAIEEKVGENYSMKNSGTISDFPYCSLRFLGLPGGSYDLEGNEGTVMSTIQVDVYTTGQKGLTQAYEIDGISHDTLVNMGYRRTYGPELDQNVDPSINRLISRYSRYIGYGETL